MHRWVPFFVDGAAFNHPTGPAASRPREMLPERVHFCLHVGVLLVFQTIFKIYIKVFLNFKTIRKEKPFFPPLTVIIVNLSHTQ